MVYAGFNITYCEVKQVRMTLRNRSGDGLKYAREVQGKENGNTEKLEHKLNA